MIASEIIALILYGGVTGSIGSIVILLLYMLVESRRSHDNKDAGE
jgi:hypothetical protein